MANRPFESRLQDLVYNMDVGIGLWVVRILLYILMLFAIIGFYHVKEFRGLKEAEAMDYAQLSRNLIQHKSLVTDVVRPASLWHLVKNNDDFDGRSQISKMPDIQHPPLYPAVLAVWFKLFNEDFAIPEDSKGIFKPEQRIIIPFMGHLFTLFSGILVFFVARQLFDSRLGYLSMSVYFLSNTVWADSVSGLNIPLLTFLTLGTFYSLLVAAGNREEGHTRTSWLVPYLLGIIGCILAFHTRYIAAVLVLPIFLFIGMSFRKHAWRFAAIFLAVFCIGIMPWLLRNLNVSGTLLGLAPYAALENTDLFYEQAFERNLIPPLKYEEVVKTIRVKWAQQFGEFLDGKFLGLGEGLYMALFLCTFFYRFVRDRTHLFRWSILIGMTLLILIGSFFGENTLRSLNIFWPFAIIYALAFLFLLVDRLQFKLPVLNMIVTSSVIFIGALPLIIQLISPRVGVPYPPYYYPWINHISRMLQPTEMICSDMPWATAWYGQRNSLYLPVDLDDFYEIHDYYKNVDGIYFTNPDAKPTLRSKLTYG